MICRIFGRHHGEILTNGHGTRLSKSLAGDPVSGPARFQLEVFGGDTFQSGFIAPFTAQSMYHEATRSVPADEWRDAAEAKTGEHVDDYGRVAAIGIRGLQVYALFSG